MRVANRRFRDRWTLAALLAGAFTAACGDLPTDPDRRLSPADAARVVGACEAQVIADPDAPCLGGGGGAGSPSVTYVDEVAPDAVSMSVSSYSDDAGNAGCPTRMSGSVVATLRSPKTGRIYDFTSSGTWVIDLIRSIIYLPARQAIYSWPPGYWPAFEQSTGNYALVKIGSARGFCAGPGRVNFFSFYNVVMEGDEPRSPFRQSGGGGDGDTSVETGSCRTEYVYIERDDGAGWYVWWEGYAQVCE